MAARLNRISNFYCVGIGFIATRPSRLILKTESTTQATINANALKGKIKCRLDH